MPICPVCKVSATEALITVRGKKMCHSCLEAKKEAARAKDAKLAAKLNDPDRKAVEQFILSLWSLDSVPVGIAKQLEQFSKTYRYTDILYALHYFYDLEEREVPSEPTVGILPYIMKEAMAHKHKLEDAAVANASFVADNEPETITVHRRTGAYQPLGYSMEDL